MTTRHTETWWSRAAMVAMAAAMFGAATVRARQDAPAPKDDQAALAELDAKEQAIVIKYCSDCHEWSQINDSRRTKDDFEGMLTDMLSRGGSSTDADFNAILDYALRHSGMVFINKAGADEIAAVIGLTAKEAQAIVAYRTEHGKFADVDAVKKVSGVDTKKIDANRAFILF